MTFTQENKHYIEHHMKVIQALYPWLGIVIFDKKEVKTIDDLIEIIKDYDLDPTEKK